MSRAPRPARAWRRAAALLAWLAAADAAAQDASDAAAIVRIEASVTAVTANNAFLDKGRLDHVEPGDPVVLRPLAAGEVKAVVRMVTRHSCRIELQAGATVEVGDRGEVLVPQARLEAEGADDAGHSAWTADDSGYDASQPLLAAPAGQAPEDRPLRIHGRWFFDVNGTWDEERGNDYQLWRSGLELTVENPFGDAGEAHVVADALRHDTHLEGGPDDSSTLLRPERASYSWGGTRQRPDRYEVGRFVQEEFPELGVLDGVEATHRLEDGGRIGASFGYMPEWEPDLQTGDDLQAAVFYRRDADERSPLSWGLAYQNTWHEGVQDRNLFVADFDTELAEDVTLSGEALVDYYGPGGDTLKDDGAQLTEAHLNGRWRLESHASIGLHASRTRWPEMKRDEFGSLTAGQVADNRVTRFGVDAWKDLSETLRLDGRLDGWTDQDDSGNSGDVRATLRDLFWTDGDFTVDVFGTNGEFTAGRGLRLSARSPLGALGYGTLSWEASSYESGVLGGQHVDTDQQAVRASLDRDLGARWNASLYAERRTGDDTDATSLGLFLQAGF